MVLAACPFAAAANAQIGYSRGEDRFILEFAALPSHTPRLASWLGALRWPFLTLPGLVWIPLALPDEWLPNTANALLVASTVIVLAASWLAWRHRNRPAGFFLLAWVPLLALTLARGWRRASPNGWSRGWPRWKCRWVKFRCASR
ncbi:MAG: 7TM diverse intracellular signaling domain-containing protein [Rhodanobacteraceae bacterium]